MMEKDIHVSIARKSLGFLKYRPAWAMVQYSIGESWPVRWKKTLARFMRRSISAQAVISQPNVTRKPDICSPPIRTLKVPKSSLKIQKGTPIVRAWKVGVLKKVSSNSLV